MVEQDIRLRYNAIKSHPKHNATWEEIPDQNLPTRGLSKTNFSQLLSHHERLWQMWIETPCMEIKSCSPRVVQNRSSTDVSVPFTGITKMAAPDWWADSRFQQFVVAVKDLSDDSAGSNYWLPQVLVWETILAVVLLLRVFAVCKPTLQASSIWCAGSMPIIRIFWVLQKVCDIPSHRSASSLLVMEVGT